MAIFAILRHILSLYSNQKTTCASSISAVRENRSPWNHQRFLADTNNSIMIPLRWVSVYWRINSANSISVKLAIRSGWGLRTLLQGWLYRSQEASLVSLMPISSCHLFSTTYKDHVILSNQRCLIMWLHHPVPFSVPANWYSSTS